MTGQNVRPKDICLEHFEQLAAAICTEAAGRHHLHPPRHTVSSAFASSSVTSYWVAFSSATSYWVTSSFVATVVADTAAFVCL